MTGPVFIHHHLGLGDHIVCNSIVRRAFNQFGNLILAVKHHNLSSVKQLYRDIDIEYYPVNSDSDCTPMYKVHKCIRIGFENTKFPYWEKSFYDQVKMDYSMRFSHFFIDRDLDRESALEEKLNLPDEFAFCNISCSTGKHDIKINTKLKKVYLSPLTDSIFDWIGVLEKATEIHIIDSSIFQLTVQFNLNSIKYFYDIRTLDSSRTLPPAEGWNIISI